MKLRTDKRAASGRYQSTDQVKKNTEESGQVIKYPELGLLIQKVLCEHFAGEHRNDMNFCLKMRAAVERE